LLSVQCQQLRSTSTAMPEKTSPTNGAELTEPLTSHVFNENGVKSVSRSK
jgi:hypothetical protein